MTEYEAQQRINELQVQYDNIEAEMIALALEYNLALYLDGRGKLLIENDHWSGKSRGEWYTSTDSCS